MRILAFDRKAALPLRRSVEVLRTCALVVGVLAGGSAPAFDLEGHRGTRGLAPENTLAAFRRALQIGVSTIETDMAVTKDGVIVLSHEPFLNPDLVRGPDGRWLASPGPSIHSLTLAELGRYDIGRTDPSSKYARQFPEQQSADGERFPQLTELFELVKAGTKPVRLNIETKITPTSGPDTPDPTTFARARGQRGTACGHERSRDGAIVRLAHPARGQAARPRDRNVVPDRTNGEHGHGQGGGRRCITLACRTRPPQSRRFAPRPGQGGGVRNMVHVLAQLEPPTTSLPRTRSGSRSSRGPSTTAPT